MRALQPLPALLLLLCVRRLAAASSAPNDVQALTALGEALDNREAFLRQPGLFGWDNEDPCPGHAATPDTGLWSGVFCDYSTEPARVTQLNLAMFPGGVKGTLPAELRRLDAVKMLELNGAGFYGTLPKAWGAEGFAALEQLNLAGNQLEGELPQDWDQGFPSLRDLNLDNNKLSGSLPTWHFSHLETLHVQGNAFSELPEDLPAAMPSLKDLSVANNSETLSVPDSWGSWSSLTSISLVDGEALCSRLANGTTIVEGKTVIEKTKSGRFSYVSKNEDGTTTVLELPSCPDSSTGVATTLAKHKSLLTWLGVAAVAVLAVFAAVGLLRRRQVYFMLGQSPDADEYLSAAPGRGKRSSGKSRRTEMTSPV